MGMTAKELIKELSEYNPDAKVNVVVNSKEEDFELTYGSSEGVEKHNCETVSFYLDKNYDKS